MEIIEQKIGNTGRTIEMVCECSSLFKAIELRSGSSEKEVQKKLMINVSEKPGLKMWPSLPVAALAGMKD